MKYLTADEAVELIKHGDTIGVGGFTAAGAPRTLGAALLQRAKEHKKQGKDFKINIITGALTSEDIDGGLSELGAIGFRVPYQASSVARKHINQEELQYVDPHLSQVSAMLRRGLFGEVDCVLLEASEVTEDGKIYLTTGVGIAPTLGQVGKKIIIELNRSFGDSLRGIHDIYEPALPPYTAPIPLTSCSQHIGTPYIQVDPQKIVGIVEHQFPPEFSVLSQGSVETQKIGEHIAQFLLSEFQAKHLTEMPPIQVGVGNIANAVLEQLSKAKEIKSYEMYSEVLQDSALEGMLSGKIKFASGGALAVSENCFRHVQQHWSQIKERLVLRPMEITNHPEIINRLGVIAINTALEADLWGNVNSTHVCGRKVVNGIGGSGDFARNAAVRIFATPSTSKGGAISHIVPLCSHIDHTEHDVQIFVTEYGVADLRGKSPRERAELIIDCCAHPQYREKLRQCITAAKAHIPIDLDLALSFHKQFLEEGGML